MGRFLLEKLFRVTTLPDPFGRRPGICDGDKPKPTATAVNLSLSACDMTLFYFCPEVRQ
jgi:hypothetical protein